MEEIEAVRAELEKHGLNEEERAWADDACISRYVRARGTRAKAVKALKASLKWRADFPVASIKADEFSEEFASGKMYVGGKDSQGRPVLITRKKADRIQAGQHVRYLRHLVFTLESAVSKMGPGVEQWVWIMDLAGYSRANSPPLSVSYATMKILADQYPERLKTAFIVDAPSVFYYLWKALAPFIDPVTKRKVRFIHSKDLRPAGVPADAAAEMSGAGSASAVDEFEEYIPFYQKSYDEIAYKSLLGLSMSFQ